MYHFVGCDEKLKGISLEGFKAQLALLQNTYPKDDIVVTFDHGTIDHLENTAPELEKRGLRGVFFVLTMVQEEHKVPSIDKQRFLEAARGTELAKMLCNELDIDYRPHEAEGYLADYGFYSLEERYLRYLRDRHIPANTYESFIGEYFQELFGAERDFASRQYLSWDDVAELQNRGHIIGSHSHYHYGDRDDYETSVKLIEGRINAKVRYVSYPNGVKRISDSDLEKLGIRKAYISTDGGVDPYRAGRIDCNQWTL